MSTWPPAAVGDVAPPLVQTIELADMIAYAGATWDWHRIHYDPAFYREKGLDRPLVDGQVFGALLVKLLQTWLGPSSFVSRLDFRYVSMMFAGETVSCHARVTGIRDETLLVEVGADNVGQERAVLGNARAEVVRRPWR